MEAAARILREALEGVALEAETVSIDRSRLEEVLTELEATPSLDQIEAWLLKLAEDPDVKKQIVARVIKLSRQFAKRKKRAG